MATCPSCHREQVQSSAFCSYCGAVLDRPASAASPSHADQAQPPPVAAATHAPSPAPAAHAHDFGDIGAYIVRRFLALLVDIVAVGALIAIAARAWIVRSSGGQLTASGFLELLIIVGVSLFVYRWVLEGIAGSTFGKLLFGLGVGRKGGGSAGLVRAFVRNVLLPIDLALIGFLLATLTPHRTRLGDLVAGTIVANSRIGVLAPLVGILALGASTLAVHSFGGGIQAARTLGNDARTLAPALMGGATPSPAAIPTDAASASASSSPTLAPPPASSPSPAASPSAAMSPSPHPTTPTGGSTT